MFNNTQRVHALFIIGADNLSQAKLNQVLAGINARYGGCTVNYGQGCWSEQGATFTQDYSNTVIKYEDAVQIEVCATPQDFDLAYLQGCFIPVAKYATWIHCEVWTTDAYHFDVKALANSVKQTNDGPDWLTTLAEATPPSGLATIGAVKLPTKQTGEPNWLALTHKMEVTK